MSKPRTDLGHQKQEIRKLNWKELKRIRHTSYYDEEIRESIAQESSSAIHIESGQVLSDNRNRGVLDNPKFWDSLNLKREVKMCLV